MAPVDWILIGGCRLDSNRIKPKHDESCFWLIFEGAQLGLCLARFINREFVLSSGLYRQVNLTWACQTRLLKFGSFVTCMILFKIFLIYLSSGSNSSSSLHMLSLSLDSWSVFKNILVWIQTRIHICQIWVQINSSKAQTSFLWI